MAEEPTTISELQTQVKAELLRAILKAAPTANTRGAEAMESLARAYAAVAGASPAKGPLSGSE